LIHNPPIFTACQQFVSQDLLPSVQALLARYQRWQLQARFHLAFNLSSTPLVPSDLHSQNSKLKPFRVFRLFRGSSSPPQRFYPLSLYAFL
jgi:hypothetical protein